jgi:hypothetical protein
MAEAGLGDQVARGPGGARWSLDAILTAGTPRPAAKARSVAGLEIEQDLDFQRRQGVFQRIGRIVFVLLLVAAILGIFGTGPLAHATASGPGFQVDYDRFLRSTQTSALQVSPQVGQGGGDIAVASSYDRSIDVSNVSPQPDSETAQQDRIVFSYQNRLPAQVQISVFPRTIGIHRATIWVRGRPMSFRQVIYP